MSPLTVGDLDLVAVERAISGDSPVVLTKAEQLEVIRRMAAKGASDNQMATATATSSRNIQRIRKAHSIPTTWSTP